MGLIAKGHPRKHAQIDQAGLLRTTHQLHLEAQLLLQGHQKIAPIGRLPHRAGGSSHDLLNPMTERQVPVLPEGPKRPLNGIGAQITGLRIPLPQARGGFFGHQHRETAQLRIHLRHQQVDGVGADIDCSDTATTQGLARLLGGRSLNHRAAWGWAAPL